MRSRRAPSSVVARFGSDRRGIAAIEFALALPTMMVLLFFGYAVCEGVAAGRKVTRTARTVVDLATQYQTMSGTDMSNVLNASSQIMVPFPTTNLTIVLSEFVATSDCKAGQTTSATVTWSKALNATGSIKPLTAGASASLPSCVAQKGASVVRSDVTYAYNPPFAANWVGAVNIHSTLYMSPRLVSSISYTGS